MHGNAKRPHNLCVRVVCCECPNPEPETASYVWGKRRMVMPRDLMKHCLKIAPNAHNLCVRIVCRECPNPEPETVSYVWEDQCGDVFFDGSTEDELLSFLAHHDAFQLTDLTRNLDGH